MSKKKYLKVLSIDFDFFQNAEPQTLIDCYPDGKDLSTDLTMLTWMTHYAVKPVYNKLMDVTINLERLGELEEILLNQKYKTPYMAVQSHIHIYDFIKNHFSDKYDGCRIVNIDMHHDCFNDNPEVDCGNWVGHIIKDLPDCQVSWIANPSSEEVYGVKSLKNVISYDFDSIRNAKFDLIFLCRSDTWTPPHLDPYFDELYQILTNNFEGGMIDPQITKPRDFEEIKNAAEQHRKQIETLYKLNHQKKG